MTIVEFSPEFSLALDCCRSHFGGASESDASAVDWARFVQLVRFHRIQGLAWDFLSTSRILVPTAAQQALREDAAAIAAANLRAAVECRRLLGAFEAAGQPILFLKGLALGVLAYGSPSLKSGIDIDVLVDPAQLTEAAAILGQLGYGREAGNGRRPIDAWHKQRKDSAWTWAGTSLVVDLHSRLTDNPRLLSGITVHSPRQLVDVGGGIRLPTLAHDETFAHLAVHGASSAWFRLKWISDFAAWISSLAEGELEKIYRRSLQLGAGRAAGQALLVADALFASLADSPSLHTELCDDRATRVLVRAALAQLRGTREPTAHFGGTLRIHWTQFLLLPGPRFKLGELARQARAAVASR